jgi:hypothetical protein
LVIAQIILFSQWFNKKILSKKKFNKNLTKKIKSKMTHPKWHFGQVGNGDKKTIWGFFLLEFLVKKTMIFCNVFVCAKFH